MSLALRGMGRIGVVPPAINARPSGKSTMLLQNMSHETEKGVKVRRNRIIEGRAGAVRGTVWPSVTCIRVTWATCLGRRTVPRARNDQHFAVRQERSVDRVDRREERLSRIVGVEAPYSTVLGWHAGPPLRPSAGQAAAAIGKKLANWTQKSSLA